MGLFLQNFGLRCRSRPDTGWRLAANIRTHLQSPASRAHGLARLSHESDRMGKVGIHSELPCGLGRYARHAVPAPGRVSRNDRSIDAAACGSATAGLKSFAAGPEPAVLLGGPARSRSCSDRSMPPGHGKVALVFLLPRPSVAPDRRRGYQRHPDPDPCRVGDRPGAGGMDRDARHPWRRRPRAGIRGGKCRPGAAIGIWLLVRALRHSHAHTEAENRTLAFATDLFRARSRPSSWSMPRPTESSGPGFFSPPPWRSA